MARPSCLYAFVRAVKIYCRSPSEGYKGIACILQLYDRYGDSSTFSSESVDVEKLPVSSALNFDSLG